MRGIDVRDLLESPGSSRTLHVEEPVPGLRTELADVPEDTPIAADLTLESVVEGIFVRGSLEGRFTMRCARCLKTFERDFDVEMAELVVDAWRMVVPKKVFAAYDGRRATTPATGTEREP